MIALYSGLHVVWLQDEYVVCTSIEYKVRYVQRSVSICCVPARYLSPSTPHSLYHPVSEGYRSMEELFTTSISYSYFVPLFINQFVGIL